MEQPFVIGQRVATPAVVTKHLQPLIRLRWCKVQQVTLRAGEPRVTHAAFTDAFTAK